MNILDNYLHNSEIKTRSIRASEGRIMRRRETYVIFDSARSDNELEKMSYVDAAINNSVGGQCRSIIPTIEEPVFMMDWEMKRDFHFWIRDVDKLLLDRKSKPQ